MYKHSYPSVFVEDQADGPSVKIEESGVFPPLFSNFGTGFHIENSAKDNKNFTHKLGENNFENVDPNFLNVSKKNSIKQKPYDPTVRSNRPAHKRITKEQVIILEEQFKKNSQLDKSRCQNLAQSLQLLTSQVKNWFRNRRRRQEKSKVQKSNDKVNDETGGTSSKKLELHWEQKTQVPLPSLMPMIKLDSPYIKLKSPYTEQNLPNIEPDSSEIRSKAIYAKYNYVPFVELDDFDFSFEAEFFDASMFKALLNEFGIYVDKEITHKIPDPTPLPSFQTLAQDIQLHPKPYPTPYLSPIYTNYYSQQLQQLPSFLPLRQYIQQPEPIQYVSSNFNNHALPSNYTYSSNYIEKHNYTNVTGLEKKSFNFPFW